MDYIYGSAGMDAASWLMLACYASEDPVDLRLNVSLGRFFTYNTVQIPGITGHIHNEQHSLEKLVGCSHIVRHPSTVLTQHRELLNGHRSAVVWFTGLPSSGKSTIAHAVEERLFKLGCRTFVLDGDNIRHGLCSDLGFSDKDRTENIRRIGEVARLFAEAGLILLTAFISPFRLDRERVRKVVGDDHFIEVFCDCPPEICEQRDPKGNYRNAREGIIGHFTGVSAPYERSEKYDLILKTGECAPEECVDQVIELLRQRQLLQCSAA